MVDQCDLALEALHLGDLSRTLQLAESAVSALNDSRLPQFWRFALVRAEVLRIRGKFEAALQYLESLGPLVKEDSWVSASYEMHRGYCLGLLGN
jgi:hypothetical protein